MRLSGDFIRVMKLGRLLDAVDRATLIWGVVVVAALTVVTVADVIGRYVFNHPIAGVYEVTQLMLVAIVFTGIAAVQAGEGHIRVEILLQRIQRRRLRTAMEIVALAFGITAFGLIGWQGLVGFLLAWRTDDYTMGLIEFPTWPAKVWIPAGSALICLRLLQQITQEIRKIVSGKASSAASTG